MLAGQSLSMFGDWAMIIVARHLGEGADRISKRGGARLLRLRTREPRRAARWARRRPRATSGRLMIVTHVAMAGVVCLLFFVHDAGDMWLLYRSHRAVRPRRRRLRRGALGDAEGDAARRAARRGERRAPVDARRPAARRAARRRGDLRRVRRSRRRARRRRNVPRLGRDARRAAVREPEPPRRAALPPRDLRGHLAHRAHARSCAS